MISLNIYGEPHPQRRPRAVRIGKHVRMHEHKSDTAWKKDAAKQIITQLPIDGSRPVFRSGVPLKVVLQFYFSCPLSDHRVTNPANLRWHTKKKDLDNLAKAVLDAGNGILWADDGQIVKLNLEKMIAPQGIQPWTSVWIDEAEPVLGKE